MRNYVGVAIDATTLEQESDEFMNLELEGFREVDLGEAKITLMLLRWSSTESRNVSAFGSLIYGRHGEEEEL